MATAAVLKMTGWRGSELSPSTGHHILPAAAADELIVAYAAFESNQLPLALVNPSFFSLATTNRFVDCFRENLAKGVGFALIDRLPLDALGEDGARFAHWIISSLIERPVAQNWRGDLVYDVTNTGRPPGNGVRPDKTNAEQNFHTDNSYNLCPPNYVALLCLRPAMTGGISHIVSFQAAHDALKAKRPDLLKRLYQPFYFDRQREHAPGDALTILHPLFADKEGELLARLSRFQVINGQSLAGVGLDQSGKDALDALDTEMNAPGMDVSFFFEPGQIQIVNNRRIGHRRTSFEDWPDETKKRLLVRLWLRKQQRKFYNG